MLVAIPSCSAKCIYDSVFQSHQLYFASNTAASVTCECSQTYSVSAQPVFSTQSFHNHGWGFFTRIHGVGKVCERRTSGDVGYAATVRPMKITAFVAF